MQKIVYIGAHVFMSFTLQIRWTYPANWPTKRWWLQKRNYFETFFESEYAILDNSEIPLGIRLLDPTAQNLSRNIYSRCEICQIKL